MRRYAFAAFALAALLLGHIPPLLAAESATALDRFLNNLSSLRTSFTQSVSDAKGKQLESGAGTLLVQRPGKFRWNYLPGNSLPGSGADASATAGSTNSEGGSEPADSAKGGQLLVADGKNLWFYDRELAQVTVKPETAALSATPMMLLSGSADQLRRTFEISADGPHDGLDWVRVKPRSQEADFGSAQLGFTHDQLTRMIVQDRLGQTVQMEFSHSERNGRVGAEDLQFKPPAGVDVIGTPQ